MSGQGNRELAIMIMLLLTIPVISYSAGTPLNSTQVPDRDNGYSSRFMVRTLWGDMHIEDLSREVPSGEKDAGSNIYIVQFEGPIRDEWRTSLEDSGADVLGYMPDYCYIIRSTHLGTSDLLKEKGVTGVSCYPSGLKTSPRFREEITGEPGIPEIDGSDELLVDLFYPDRSVETVLDTQSVGVERGSDTRYVLQLPIVSLDRILSLPQIRWVEPRYRPEPDNNVSRTIVAANMARNDLGLDGKGQIVAIADTGVDTGVDNHSVNGDMIADLDNRITTSVWAGPNANDTHSHGTHVAGSVAGNGSLSNGKIEGMAPEADIFFQSIANQTRGNRLELPSNLSSLFQEAYDFGARIHTNSWGSSVYGQYTLFSRDVDWFLYSHPDMIILFSAGNSGMDYYKPWGTYNPDGKIDPDSVGSPASAKDCITVGASENLRSDGGYSHYPWGIGSWLWKYSVDPIRSDLTSNNISGLAAFSSRGPTDDGRLKPDVVAPGTNILSLRSNRTSATGWGLFSSNPHYMFMGGTSMSTPITAGTVALLRQYFNETLGMDDPSGALLKAALINGATDLTPGQYGSSNSTTQEINRRPDNDQGWGRVNVSESVSPADGNLAFLDDSEGINTGEEMGSYLNVRSSSKDLRVTLVWSDRPGEMAASKKLVNDLDLILVAPNGSVYNGNDLSAPFNDTRDDTNPVEGVTVPSPAVGVWKIVVNGTNIPLGPQHFALAASGDVSNMSGVIRLDSRYYSTDGDRIGIELFDQDMIGNGTVSVTIMSNTSTSARILTLTEDGISGRFIGSIVTVNITSSNTSLLPVSDNDTITVSYTDTDPAGVFNSTATAKDPVRFNMFYRPEYALTFSEYERFFIKGWMETGIDAWWTLEGTSRGWRALHDDGNSTFGDESAGDGNYTDIWFVPPNTTAVAVVRVMIRDPFLGIRYYDHFTLRMNTSVPRFPKNLTAEVRPQGNTVILRWDPSNETDLSHQTLYVNSSSPTYPEGWSGYTLLVNTSSPDTSITIGNLTDGVHYLFRVSAVDINGNESSMSLPFNTTPEDTEPPLVDLVTTPKTIVGKIHLEFTGSPDLAVVEVGYYNDSNGNGMDDDGGVWADIGMGYPDNYTWDTRLDDGGPGDMDSMLLRYRGEDEVPNISQWVNVTGFRVDNTGPSSVEILDPPPRVTNIGIHHLNGISESLGRVEVWVNGTFDSNNSCDDLGVFSFDLDLAEGINNVTLEAYDRYGAGPTVRTYWFTLDTMPPVPRLDVEDQVHVFREIGPVSYLFNSTSYDLGLDPHFRYIDNITWTYRGIDGIPRTTYIEETYSIIFTELGVHELTLAVRDPAGNTASMMLTITVFDSTPPVISIDGKMNVNEDTTLTYTINISDNDPRMRLRENFSVSWELTGPYGFVDNRSSEIVRIVFPEPGTYTAHVLVTDGGNNTSELTINITVADITPPEGNILGNTAVILGIPETYTINLTDNGRPMGDGSTFNWSLQYLDGPPGDWWTENFTGTSITFNFTQTGAYILVLTAADPSGNMRTFQINIDADGDLTPPHVDRLLPTPNGSFQFSETTHFIIIFSEKMNRSTLTPETIHLVTRNESSVNATLDIKTKEGRTEVTLSPVALSFGTIYTLVVETAVMDQWDNHMLEPFSANYTVRTLFRLVYPWGPSHSEFFSNFSNTTSIILRFSNPVSASTIQNYVSIRALITEADPVSGIEHLSRIPVPFTASQGDDNYTIVIDALMDEGGRYNFTLSREALDIFNYGLDRDYIWDFTTYLPPTVNQKTPDNDTGNGPLPDWMNNPIWWILASVVFIVILILILIFAAVRRKRNLDKIWQEGSEERPVTGEEPVESSVYETGSEEVKMEEPEKIETSTLSYEDLYGVPPPIRDMGGTFISGESGGGNLSVDTGPQSGNLPGNDSNGIDWDEDSASEEEDEDWNEIDDEGMSDEEFKW